MLVTFLKAILSTQNLSNDVKLIVLKRLEPFNKANKTLIHDIHKKH